MKKAVAGALTLLGYALLLVAPGLLLVVLSVFCPTNMWSRMKHETQKQYAQRIQLQAIAFRSRMLP
jgi:hypothetical protein